MRLRPRFSNRPAASRSVFSRLGLGWPRLMLRGRRPAGRSSARTGRLPVRWQMPMWPGRLPTWAEVQRLPLSLMIACLLAALGTVQMTFLIGNGLYRNYIWQQEVRSVKLLIQLVQCVRPTLLPATSNVRGVLFKQLRISIGKNAKTVASERTRQ